MRVEGRGQVGLREREDNKWKPARSTLKVRKTLYSLLKNISICGICVLVFFFGKNSINPCNKNKQHRLKQGPPCSV